MIEQYCYTGKGYHPYLIREGWQVAQLNHVEKHGLDDIDSLEVHRETDEVFILFEGTAILIAAEMEDDYISYEVINMCKGVTYNIPQGKWHNIAMDRDARMIIVEKSDTHLNDCTLFSLDDSQKEVLYQKIQEVL